MDGKTFALLVLVLAGILQTSEVTAKKNKLTVRAKTFETPSRYAKKESFVIIGNTDGSEKIFVKLNLGSLTDGEIVSVTDDTKDTYTSKPQILFYRKNNGELQVLDVSAPEDEQAYVAVPPVPVQFESDTGRALVIFYGDKKSNYGGLTGEYRKYHVNEMSRRCKTSDLLQTSGRMQCDDEFAGYATSCQGNFACPPHFFATGFAECSSEEWKSVCLPGPSALDILNDPAQCVGEGRLTNCPLDVAYLNALNDFDLIDDEVQHDSGAGRRTSIASRKKTCSKFCQPRQDCRAHRPHDFTNNRKAVHKFMLCQNCVYVYQCDFSQGIHQTIFG